MAQAARLNLRMQKELKLLMTDPPPGVSFPLLEAGENPPSPSLSNIEARIEGPEGTVYSKGVFTVRIQIPERYPFQPPNVTFATPIYHPNIDNGGRICLDILNLPPKGAWQPSLNISTVLTSIGLLLSEPNPDDGLMAETSREYKYNKQAFDQTARLWTEKYANAGESGRGNDGSVSTVNPQPETEIIKEEALYRDAIIEAEGSRKKLRLNGDKLSLKSKTKTTVEINRDDEENQAPSRKLSISHSQNPFVVASSISQIRDDKENVAPIRKLSISRAHKTLAIASSTSHKTLAIASSTSHIGENVLNSGELSSLCGNKQDVDSDVKQVEEGSPKNIESIIISDSEESDEGEGPPRSRFSLMRKQIVGKQQKS